MKLNRRAEFMMDGETEKRLAAVAKNVGVGPSTLARILVLDGLRSYEQRGTATHVEHVPSAGGAR